MQAAEAASAAQQTEPQPAGGGTKKDKERQRKERQRQRKMDEAREALQVAIEAMLEEAAGSVKAVEEAMAEAEKHASRSEQLAALVAEAKGLIEQARAAEAERASLAAEAAAAVQAAAAAEAAEKRQKMEERLAALTLGDAARRVGGAADASLAGRATGGTRAPPGGGTVRNVPGRAHGSHHHPVRPPVRVRGVCGGAEAGGTPRVSSMSGAHQRHRQGVSGLERTMRCRASTILLSSHLSSSGLTEPVQCGVLVVGWEGLASAEQRRATTALRPADLNCAHCDTVHSHPAKHRCKQRAVREMGEMGESC